MFAVFNVPFDNQKFSIDGGCNLMRAATEKNLKSESRNCEDGPVIANRPIQIAECIVGKMLRGSHYGASGQLDLFVMQSV